MYEMYSMYGREYHAYVNVGLSFRDCPFYRVVLDGKQIASGMGRMDAAVKAIIEHCKEMNK